MGAICPHRRGGSSSCPSSPFTARAEGVETDDMPGYVPPNTWYATTHQLQAPFEQVCQPLSVMIGTCAIARNATLNRARIQPYMLMQSLARRQLWFWTTQNGSMPVGPSLSYAPASSSSWSSSSANGPVCVGTSIKDELLDTSSAVCSSSEFSDMVPLPASPVTSMAAPAFGGVVCARRNPSDVAPDPDSFALDGTGGSAVG